MRQRYAAAAWPAASMCGCSFSAPLSPRQLCIAASCGACTRAQQRSAAGQHRNTRVLRQLLRLSPSTSTAALLAELGHLSLQQRWLQAAVRCWNALVALPAGDFNCDILYDSLQEAVAPLPWPNINQGFVKGLLAECGRVGYNLTAMQQLQPTSLEIIMALAQQQQQQREAAVTNICPHTCRQCPTAGAADCTYKLLISSTPTAEREAVPLDVRAVSVCAQSHAAAALAFRLPQPAVGSGPPQQPACAAP